MSTTTYVLIVIMISAMIGTALVLFERRKPKASELVLLAVLCAIAVISRVAFIWVPYFKPIVGVVMLIGIILGPSAGFLCGTLSALLSNFIFGQGPWTPWQMIAFGLGGLVMGLLYHKKDVQIKPIRMAIVGGALTMLMVGVILDSGALFMVPANSLAGFLSVYVSGLPVNSILALATFLTILIFGKPLNERVHRVLVKYGMLGD